MGSLSPGIAKSLATRREQSVSMPSRAVFERRRITLRGLAGGGRCGLFSKTALQDETRFASVFTQAPRNGIMAQIYMEGLSAQPGLGPPLRHLAHPRLTATVTDHSSAGKTGTGYFWTMTGLPSTLFEIAQFAVMHIQVQVLRKAPAHPST